MSESPDRIWVGDNEGIGRFWSTIKPPMETVEYVRADTADRYIECLNRIRNGHDVWARQEAAKELEHR